MEELLEEYKQTLNAVIEKYSDFEKMTINDFISKYAELKQFSIHGVSGMFSEKHLIQAYNDGMEAEQQRCDNFDIENYL
jgi:hypothetical protein